MLGGETCATALTITPGTINGTTTGAMNDYFFNNGNTNLNGCAYQASGSAAPDTVFQISVPNNNRLTVAVTTAATPAGFDAIVQIIAAPATNCGSGNPTTGITCLATADSVVSGTETATYANTSGAAQTVFIMIEGYATTANAGPFTMVTSLAAIPQGDNCASAVTVTGNVTAQAINGFASDYVAGDGCLGSSGSGPDRVYQVSVGAGQRLTASATPDAAPDAGAQFNPIINIVSTPVCAATLACTTSADGTLPTATDTVIWDNTGAAARTVFIVIDTDSTTSTGNFSLNVNTTPTSFAAGESCGNAGPTAITANTSLTAQSFTSYANNYVSAFQPACRYGGGPDRVYLVDIPAGQNFTATARQTTLDGGLDLALSVVDDPSDCGAGPCISGSDNSGGAGDAIETVTATNAGASARRVRVVVDSKVAAPPGTFGIDFAFAAPLMGDVCSSATVIAASGTLMNQTTVGYTNDYNGDFDCDANLFGTPGFDRVYSVTVNAGQTLSVTAAPPVGSTGNSADLGVYLIAGPATNCIATPIAPQCLDGNDQGIDGAPETVSYMNATGAAQTVFIVVDCYYAMTAITTFSLQVSLTP